MIGTKSGQASKISPPSMLNILTKFSTLVAAILVNSFL